MSTPYRLDKKRSRFTVKVRAGGVLSGLGHNPTIAVREVAGAGEFDSQEPNKSSLQLTVRADSLEVTDDIKKQDKQEIEERMRKEVLEVDTYPEITFRSIGISAQEAGGNLYRLQITGHLSLHGTTRDERIDAQAKVRDNEVQLSGDFKLNQSDYKIKRASALAGALKVNDELQISFDIKGNKQ